MRARLTTAATRQRPRWTADAAVALLYAACALAFTYPLWINPGTHIAFKASGDQLWVLSLLEWMRTALFSRPDEFFVGNFYFGSGGAMFGSHLMLGYLPIYGPLAWVTQNPVLAYSLTHIAAYALNAGAMYAAVLVLTRSRPGALLAGAIYAFGPLQLAYSNHFQFLGAWWLPLVLLFGVRVWRGGGWLDFGLATLMVWVQFTTNAHLGLIAAMVFAAFVALPAVYRVASERNFRLGLGMVAAGTLVTAPFIPIVQGYLSFSEAWRLDRDITEVQFWSVQLRDYLSPNGRLQWYGALTERFPVPRGEHRVFPGFVPPLLAAVGVGAGLVGQRVTGKGLRIVTILLVMLAAAGVLFSLGTHWKRHEVVSDIALPYLQLFQHVPAFQGIRVVARFSLLAHFAIAVLAGIGVYAITRGLSGRWAAAPLVGLVATALVLVEAAPRPLSTFEIPTDPPLRAALRDARPGPMIFVPVSGKDEVWRIWMTTETGAGPIVNGYSGHIWKQYWFFRDQTQDLISSQLPSLAAGLQAYGIRAVAVDLGRASDQDRAAWAAFARGGWVVDVNRVNQHLLVSLADPASPPDDSWTDLDTTLLADVVEPSAGFTGMLVQRNPDTAPWIPPGDPRVRSVKLAWVRTDGSVEFEHESDMLPPPFLGPGQFHATPMHVFTPSESNNYVLRATTDDEVIFERRVLVAPVQPVAYAGSAKGMVASLTLRSPASVTLAPGESAPLQVEALNIGQKSWDAAEANVRFGWRWWKINDDGSEVEQPEYEGRVPLWGHIYSDIPPGRGYAFAGRLRAPDEPGRYVVRASMLVELVGWFENDPVEIEVIVQPANA